MHVGVGGWGVLARLEYNLHWSPREGAPITVLVHPLGPKDDHLCALRTCTKLVAATSTLLAPQHPDQLLGPASHAGVCGTGAR